MASLSGVPETMLIPLWAKALESRQKKPIFTDLKAGEILLKIDYDFSKFSKSWLSQTGVVVRTSLIDQALTDFLDRYGRSIVVNLGAGLDTRFSRLNDGRISHWYDLDLPEGITLRREFFSESATVSFIEASLFDESWLSRIDRGRLPVFFICEGVLMYFSEALNKSLLSTLAHSFPSSEFVFDIIPPLMVSRAKYHDSVSKIKTASGEPVEFKWGVRNPQDLAEWDEHITVKSFQNYYRQQWRRWSWFGLLSRLPIIRGLTNCGIITLEFD